MIRVSRNEPEALGLRKHPCISPEAFGKNGRVHLPVSPACNIQCGFCTRKFHPTASAPGIARQLLSPEAAADRVDRALEICPEITVAGIAGPGDPLATDHAERTFSLIHLRHPDLVLCMSTNGLEIARKAASLWEIGVRSVTVTVNSLQPPTVAQIVPRIAVDSRMIAGTEAAEKLIARQLEGIDKMASLGAFVKINFVLIPGLNDQQVSDVAQTASRLGASRINIIPLLPQGTFAEHRPPNCTDIERARAAAEPHLPVFRHCQRCRADACGIPGKPTPIALGNLLESDNTFSHG
jgi:nitrogen fixation protein NifB